MGSRANATSPYNSGHLYLLGPKFLSSILQSLQSTPVQPYWTIDLLLINRIRFAVSILDSLLTRLLLLLRQKYVLPRHFHQPSPSPFSAQKEKHNNEWAQQLPPAAYPARTHRLVTSALIGFVTLLLLRAIRFVAAVT